MDDATRAYLDALIKPVADDVAEIKSDVKDMRADIGVLQRFRAQVFAILGMVVIVGSSGAAWVALLR